MGQAASKEYSRVENTDHILLDTMDESESEEELFPVTGDKTLLTGHHTEERWYVTLLQIFVPFLVLDLVVASVLASVNLGTLNPSTVSLPFKLLLFVLKFQLWIYEDGKFTISMACIIKLRCHCQYYSLICIYLRTS